MIYVMITRVLSKNAMEKSWKADRDGFHPVNVANAL